MKYRLKKDLPFFVGQWEVRFSIEPGIALGIMHRDTYLEIRVKDKSQIDTLIREGWIEEVKPREFKLFFDSCGDLERISENGIVVRIDNRPSMKPSREYIKVREIIE